MNNKIWLSSPHMGGNEQKFVKEAFDTNWIAPLGPHLNGFEEDIKIYLGANKEVAALSSGTAAIHLALLLSGVKANDEVICQSFTFCASANPIVYLGASPIFVDSEKDTWNMDASTIEKNISKKTKAIMIVHIYGLPVDIDPILKIYSEFSFNLISQGAKYE